MRFVVSALGILLSGCGAAQLGYQPTSGEPDRTPAMLKPFNGGYVDDKGRYIVTPDEKLLTCGKLTGSMHVMIARLKDRDNRPRPGFVTSTMQAIAQPIAGKGADLDVDREIQQARARLKAYNGLLAEKECKTVDVSAVM